jgi:hypothetical protein
MKQFYILVMTLMVVIQGSSQTTYYWQPAAGGSWSTANNWVNFRYWHRRYFQEFTCDY